MESRGAEPAVLSHKACSMVYGQDEQLRPPRGLLKTYDGGTMRHGIVCFLRRMTVPCGVIIVSSLLLVGTASCRRSRHSAQPEEAGSSPTKRLAGADRSSPPDLRRCTRVEVRYLPSLSQALFPAGKAEMLLSAQEIEYLRSLNVLTIRERRRIEALASSVRLGSYIESAGFVGVRFTAHVTCYEGDRCTASFDVSGPCIYTSDGLLFEYPRSVNLLVVLRGLMPEVQPFMLRLQCAGNLADLRRRLLRTASKGKGYPVPKEWCDAIVLEDSTWTGEDGRGGEDRVRGIFTCPGGAADKSHYAMNPDCKADSPADVVLLFETQAGWNQHGGPELFTFENHDPKGGLVLLNDGTVKFIRTEEELKQLRWK
jgi:hypothetical protein